MSCAVNVNRLKDFDEIKKKEMQMEKEMFAEARRSHTHTQPHSADHMVETIPWRRPPILSLGPDALPVKGCNSTEREAQKKREEGVLFALYFSKNM